MEACRSWSAHHHETQLAPSAAEIYQATADKATSMEVFITQVQQFINAFIKSTADPSAVLSSVRTTSSIPAPEAEMGALECYVGDPENCNPFLTNCSILFALQAHTFASEKTRVAFTINHLTGRAHLVDCRIRAKDSSMRLIPGLCNRASQGIWGVLQGPYSMAGLLKLRQGARHVADHAIDFRT